MLFVHNTFKTYKVIDWIRKEGQLTVKKILNEILVFTTNDIKLNVFNSIEKKEKVNSVKKSVIKRSVKNKNANLSWKNA